MAKVRKYRAGFKQQPIRKTYSELRLTIESRAGEPGSIDLLQADKVHRKWKRLGKLVAQGPAAKIK